MISTSPDTVEHLAKMVSSTPMDARGTNVPTDCTFSHDGQLLVFLDTAPESGAQYLACLHLGTMQRRDLFRTDVGDNEDNLSLEEKLRRERMRQYATGVTSYIWNGRGKIFLPLQGALYALDPFVPGAEPEVVLAKSTTLPAAPPMLGFQVSEDRRMIGFTQAGEVYISLLGEGEKYGAAVRQTFTAGDERGGVTNGVASFIAQEEMDRGEGFWLPKGEGGGALLAYEHVDESGVAQVCIGAETYRYPFAGQSNPVSQLRVREVSAAGKEDEEAYRVADLKLHWKDKPEEEEEEEIYLAKVEWFSATELAVQIMNRKQTRLELQMIDCSAANDNMQCEVFVVEENAQAWVNLQTSNCTFVPRQYYPPASASGARTPCLYVWSSERDEAAGWCSQLFLYDRAQLLRRITPGPSNTVPPFVVDCVLAMDAEWVYFAGNLSHATDRNVLAARWNKEEENDHSVVMLTDHGTAHAAVFSPSRDQFVLTHSSLTEPITVTLRHVSTTSQQPPPPLPRATKRSRLAPSSATPPPHGKVQHYSFASSSLVDDAAEENQVLAMLSAPFDFAKLPAYATSPPSSYSCTLRDGKTVVHSQLFIPSSSGDGPFPTIVYIYGGPHVQRVCNNWQATVDFRSQALRKMGFLVVKCDARGSSRRGLAFEAPLKHAMGTVELEDHIDVLQQLAALDSGGGGSGGGLVDMDRGVGIMGWSYGGYMSALAVAKHADVFKVAVAGAPVTYWHGYDTCYTERYMGLPSDNAAGYASACVMSHVASAAAVSKGGNGTVPAPSIPFGKLLLIHGMMDENVHFTHTTKLIERLTECNKPYDLVVLPQERHGPRNAASKAYIENRILAYFAAHL